VTTSESLTLAAERIESFACARLSLPGLAVGLVGPGGWRHEGKGYGYGLGVEVDLKDGYRRVGHQGDCPGYGSYAYGCRLGVDPASPERVEFTGVVDGRPSRAVVSGWPFDRVGP